MTQVRFHKLAASFFLVCLLTASFPAVCPVQARLAAAPVTKKTNTSMEPLIPALSQAISASTPLEPSSSDLILFRRATRLSTRRLPQGFTTDGSYYYFLSNLASSGKNSMDLRLTRVCYLPDGTYRQDYMTLEGFGHGTNLDCCVSNGKTWLWTGSDPLGKKGSTSTISCFTFVKGKTLKKHAKIRYKIPGTGKKGKALNCFPAVSPDGKKLAVRFTDGKKQHFKIYRLIRGCRINTTKPLKTFRRSRTRGDFQGFDLRGSVLYTIEGSASAAECRELHKKWYPVIIRSYDYKSKKFTLECQWS